FLGILVRLAAARPASTRGVVPLPDRILDNLSTAYHRKTPPRVGQNLSTGNATSHLCRSALPSCNDGKKPVGNATMEHTDGISMPSDVPARLFAAIGRRRLEVSRKLGPKRRGEMGQFFTPLSTARLMASFFKIGRDELRLLDPGAGIGSLTAAWVADLCSPR